MYRTALAMLAMIALSGCTTQEADVTSTPPAFSADDESAVRTIVSEFANTWNHHDMKAMHELNTDDVEWINVSGNHWRGNATVFKGHETIHRTIFAKQTMSVEEIRVRAIAPGVAIAVATMIFGAVMPPSGEEIPAAKTRGSFVLVKHDDGWKIIHFQNTIFPPFAEQNDPITWDSIGIPEVYRRLGWAATADGS